MIDEEHYPEVDRLSTMERVTTEMAAAGFVLMPPPDFPCPVLRPSDLTHNNISLYAQKFAQFEQWRSYSRDTLAHLDGWIAEYRNKLKRIGLKSRLSQRLQKLLAKIKIGTEKSLSDAYEGREDYMTLTEQLQELEQKRYIVDSMWQRANSGANTMSRFIEVRKEGRSL